MAFTFISEKYQEFRHQTTVGAQALPRGITLALLCHPVFPLPAHGNLRELGLSVLICPSLTSIFFACFVAL